MARPETAAVPEALRDPKELMVAPVIVPVALKLAPVKSPAKNPPPWTAKILERAAVEVPNNQEPEVAVIDPKSKRSKPSASTS